MYFIIEKISDGKLYHFLVKEKINNGSVTYKINQITLVPQEVDRLKSKIIYFQNGGKKYKKDIKKDIKKNVDDELEDDDLDEDLDLDLDDDDELDDSDDMYNMIRYGKRITSPIKYWIYDPIAYARYMETFYTPNFIVPLAPYVEICMPPCIV